MFIYNVTIKLDHSIHKDWVQWMKEVHLPEVMQTGCFEKFQFVRLLDTDETEGPTYAAQYYAISMAQYNRYIDLYAPKLRQASFDKWGNGFIAFRTLMQIIA